MTVVSMLALAAACGKPPPRESAPISAEQTIDLVRAFDQRRFRLGSQSFLERFLSSGSSSITTLPDRDGVHLPGRDGYTVAWIEGTSFQNGTLEVELRGKDCRVCSFVGIAFHRVDDGTYQAVYVRPYTFRITDLRLKHQTVQYITMPEHERDRRRRGFDADKWAAVAKPVTSAGPDDWVVLRVVVSPDRLQAYVGTANEPNLEVRRPGGLNAGEVGLWTGSDGDFRRLVITPAQ